MRKPYEERQIEVFNLLVLYGECAVSDVALHCGFSRTAARNLLERMCRDGMLNREFHDASTPLGIVLYTPTEWGASLIERHMGAQEGWVF